MDAFAADTVFNVSIGVLICGLAAFILLMCGVAAPYGRYCDKNLARVDFLVPGRISWLIMESPNLLLPVLYLYHFETTFLWNRPNFILITMYLIHYIYRDLIFPFLGRMKPMAISALSCGVIFCCINSYIQCTGLLLLYKYDENFDSLIRMAVGGSIWLYGLSTNIYSDHLLRTLRKPGETGYKVPRGGWFDYVSCANFFGEIVEWWGYALACWSFGALTFAAFTAANLIPRGIAHHRYYLQKMEDYPKHRKAVIPFLF